MRSFACLALALPIVALSCSESPSDDAEPVTTATDPTSSTPLMPAGSGSTAPPSGSFTSDPSATPVNVSPEVPSSIPTPAATMTGGSGGGGAGGPGAPGGGGQPAASAGSGGDGGSQQGVGGMPPDVSGGSAGEAMAGNGGSSAGTNSGGAGASAGAAGSAGSAGAGSDDYSPCPEDGPCVIMPFGDSITEGCCNFNGGYRVPLYRAATQAGQNITFVGSTANGPMTVDGMPFPRNHEGHGGFTIDDMPGRGTNGISPFVSSSIPAYEPDIVLLMIGTNDINGNIEVGSAPNRLGALLDSIHEADPEILTVLAQIVPTTNDGTNQAVSAYNETMPGLVAERVAEGHHLMLVDMYEGMARDADYKTALFADGLHPNDAGYERMAEIWYEAISPYLR